MKSYILSNVFFFFCLVCSYGGAEGYKIICIFYVLFCFVCSLFFMFNEKSTLDRMKDHKPKVPVWFDRFYDCVCFVLMVSMGWYVLSVLYIIHTIILIVFVDKMGDLN